MKMNINKRMFFNKGKQRQQLAAADGSPSHADGGAERHLGDCGINTVKRSPAGWDGARLFRMVPFLSALFIPWQSAWAACSVTGNSGSCLVVSTDSAVYAYSCTQNGTDSYVQGCYDIAHNSNPGKTVIEVKITHNTNLFYQPGYQEGCSNPSTYYCNNWNWTNASPPACDCNNNTDNPTNKCGTCSNYTSGSYNAILPMYSNCAPSPGCGTCVSDTTFNDVAGQNYQAKYAKTCDYCSGCLITSSQYQCKSGCTPTGVFSTPPSCSCCTPGNNCVGSGGGAGNGGKCVYDSNCNCGPGTCLSGSSSDSNGWYTWGAPTSGSC